MENSSKALYIAGSVLIAVLVISLLVYTFDKLGVVEEQKDEIAYEESITEFNREYEAFNKRIMYGVDVISCINKAVSNNEKFVNGGKWSLGGVAGLEALVQVEVDLKNGLEEYIEIFYWNDTKEKEVKIVGSFPDVSDDADSNDEDAVKELENKDIIDLAKKYDENVKIPGITGIKDVKIKDIFSKNIKYEKADNFTLLKQNKLRTEFNETNTSLFLLSSNVSDLQIVIENPNTDTWDVWKSIKWTTCLADFKRKKFGCEEINYNQDTGYIDYIKFKEK